MIELNAVTLVAGDMAAAVRFWTVPEGFVVVFGGADAPFTTIRTGRQYLNLMAHDGDPPGFWGRFIIHVPSPDDVHRAYAAAGYPSETVPADADWGERYFHIRDPFGHEVSFARRLAGSVAP